MNKTLIFAAIAIVVLGIVGTVSAIGVGLSWYTTENNQRLLVNAQQKKNEVVFDNTWKTIAQIAQVSDDYKNSFKEIYVGIMDGRYGKGDGTLMKWVQESNPNFDISLFTKLTNVIEGSNAEFTENQKVLIDLAREHERIITTPPASIFYSILGKEKIDIKLVTSTKTENAFKTGKNDNINIRGN